MRIKRSCTSLKVRLETDGLTVLVIKEADQKALVKIARGLKVFRKKAREMRFSAEDLSGGRSRFRI